jgi:hypothetical protein
MNPMFKQIVKDANYQLKLKITKITVGGFQNYFGGKIPDLFRITT